MNYFLSQASRIEREIAREAVHATPEDHPDRAGWLNMLGLTLGDRYSRTRAMADLKKPFKLREKLFI